MRTRAGRSWWDHPIASEMQLVRYRPGRRGLAVHSAHVEAGAPMGDGRA